jgi:hypothetical protein
MVLRIIGTVGLSSKHGDCLDFVVLGRLKQYLKDLADAIVRRFDCSLNMDREPAKSSQRILKSLESRGTRRQPTT